MEAAYALALSEISMEVRAAARGGPLKGRLIEPCEPPFLEVHNSVGQKSITCDRDK